MPASVVVSRTIETKRAASSEWPPRSVKKSASKRDRLRRQHALCGSKQRRLDLVARLFLRLGRDQRNELQFLQTVAIDLAGDERRQGGEKLEARRHHIGRQFGAQLAAQQLAVDLGAARRHDEGDELVEPVMLAQNDGGIFDAGAFGELRFDLAELDAKAADLHLIVDAAAKQEIALLIDDDGIARAIEHRIAVRIGERIGDEFFAR